jgi:hypothetical protein
MDLGIKYRGLSATQEDVEFINELIASNPNDSRRALSIRLCRAWNWVQPNGVPRDMVCRGFMLVLHRAGLICLPSRRCRPNNPLARRKKPHAVDVDDSAFTAKLNQIEPLEFRQVRRTGLEPMFNSLIERYHYLGYCQPVGEHLKYIVFSGLRPVACMSCSSAPLYSRCRDRFIGWPAQVRKQNLHLVAYNNRFLILPRVRIKHLASHILGRITRILPEHWQAIYHHRVYFLETFVDTQLFDGTCYKAANWIYLGNTKGLGKDNRTHKINRSIKAVWGYPLSKDFRNHLLGVLK